MMAKSIIYLLHIYFQDYTKSHPDSQALVGGINSKYYYYTRTRGLFRICYPKERPPTSAGKLKTLTICNLPTAFTYTYI